MELIAINDSFILTILTAVMFYVDDFTWDLPFPHIYER